MAFSIGQRLSLTRASLPLPSSSSSSSSSSPPPVVVAHVVSRAGANARSWNIRIDSENVDLCMSTRAILAAVRHDEVPAPRENLRVRAPVDHGAFVVDCDNDGDDGGSEYSGDDSLEDTSDDEKEEEDGDEEDPPARRDPLIPNGLKWTPLPDGENLLDPRPSHPLPMRLVWSAINLLQFGSAATAIEAAAQDLDSRTPFHYFLLSFPVDIVHGIVDRTNAAINTSEGRQTQLTVQLFFKYIGIIYLMGLIDLDHRRKYWEKTPSKAFPPFNFGRFMEITYWEHFHKHISWSAPNANDRWASVRDVFTGFNARRVATVTPGDKLTVDEAMSANRTNRTVRNNVPHGLPHQTKIARKPEGVGCEIRCVIDSGSEVMLQLEIQESKEEMATKRFVQEVEKVSTAGVLRLVEPWFGTHRTVYGDSAFASVWTAYHLRKRGLHFMGLVKTGYKEFPKAYLRSLNHPVRSGMATHLTATKENIHLVAVGWWDKIPKHIVATAGSNKTAPPHCRKRYRLLPDGTSVPFEKHTPITDIPYEYFDNAQKVDVHNHRRQGILALERKIPTQKWSFRLVCTVLGMIMVDAYMMYHSESMRRSDVNGLMALLSFGDFVESAAVDLATNAIIEGALRGGRPRSSSFDDQDREPPETLCGLISISKMIQREGKKRKFAHRLCKICNRQTQMCCRRCSSEGHVVPICGFGAHRDVPCFSKHIQSIAEL